MTGDRIEILPVSILETERRLTREFQDISSRFGIGLGWHYLIDLCWAVRQLVPAPGMRVIDAGAGTGIIQWWLAEQGVDVLSVDRLSRHDLPMCFRQQYRILGWRKEDLAPLPRSGTVGFSPLRSFFQKVATSFRKWRWKQEIPPDKGTVFIYNQEISSMPDIIDNSVDAVVSISALEHNPADRLRACVAELMRVLKPGGKLVATLSAAKDQDWFHEPSKGWCYTEATLRDIFELSPDCSSKYDRYDELFEALLGCSELRDNLADFYFHSPNNGMPWGIWDPKYQPVGVVKIKRYE